MSKIAIMQPQYFPWPGFFELFLSCDQFVILDHVQIARGFTNRVQIKTKSGPQWLTVPIVKTKRETSIIDAKASQEVDWQNKHRQLLIESYKMAPNAGDVLEIFDELVSKKELSISEIANSSTKLLLEYFGIANKSRIFKSSELQINASKSDLILDIVQLLGGSTYISGHGGIKYLDHLKFENNGIEIFYIDYRLTEYRQEFGAFNPFVSTLDVVANIGPEAKVFLNPITISWRDFIRRNNSN